MTHTTVHSIPALVDLLRTPLTTSRCVLTLPHPDHAVHMHEAVLETYEQLHIWMDWARRRPTLESIRARIELMQSPTDEVGELQLLLLDQTDEQLLGSIGMHHFAWNIPRAEIGYWCRRSRQGEGHITEAVRALTSFAIDTAGFKRIDIRTHAGNRSSRRTAELAGFTLEGILRHYTRHVDGSLRDECVYAYVAESCD